MRNSITIRRWRIDIYESAIYIQKQPDPTCTDCDGRGYTERGRDVGDSEYFLACSCWNPFRSLRIPLGRRAVITERFPF